MGRWRLKAVYLVVMVAAAMVMVGCREERARERSVEPRRLTVADLAPPQMSGPAWQVDLQVVVFDVPVGRAEEMDGVFGLLRTGPIRFGDRAALEANGLRAAFGPAQGWRAVAEKLNEIRARQVYTNTLMHFDDRGLDVVSLPVLETTTAVYTGADGGAQSVELETGQVAWASLARPDESLRGVADVTLRYVYRRQKDMAAARIARQDRVKERVFAFTVLAMKMSRGDFVLVGPTGYREPVGNSLLDWAFMIRRSRTDGDDMLRFYLVFCVQVRR